MQWAVGMLSMTLCWGCCLPFQLLASTPTVDGDAISYGAWKAITAADVIFQQVIEVAPLNAERCSSASREL